MTLPADEFIRRFRRHIRPDGFHRIRHYGLFPRAVRAANIKKIRALLEKAAAGPAPSRDQSAKWIRKEAMLHCRRSSRIMTAIETFA